MGPCEPEGAVLGVPPRALIFHPISVALLSLAGAALYVAAATLRYSPEKLYYQYLYVAPVIIPFVAFLFDRAERFRSWTGAQCMVDAFVIGLSVYRAVGHVPLVSGHALFLTYALLTARSRVARAAALVVLIQVLYLKLLIWHDPVTPSGALLLGSAAALVYRKSSGAGSIAED